MTGVTANNASALRFDSEAHGFDAISSPAQGTDGANQQAPKPRAANAAVGRIEVEVEVERDAVPADGQSPVQLVPSLFGRDGQPLKTPAFVTIVHSGGRILLTGGRADPRLVAGDLPQQNLCLSAGTATAACAMTPT